MERIPQLDAMRLGTEYRFVIKLRDFTLTVRPLTSAEYLAVTNTVIMELSKIPEVHRTQIKESLLMAREILKLASTSGYGAGDIHLTDMLLDRMTVEEINHLYQQYCDISDRVNPNLEKMKPEDLQAFVAELKKSSKSDLDSLLTALTISRLREVCRSLLQEP